MNELLCSVFSFSLEGLTGGAGVGNKPSSSLEMSSANSSELRNPFSGEEQRDSLMSLSEEHLEPDQRQHHRMFDQQVRLKSVYIANGGGSGTLPPKYDLIVLCFLLA